MTYAWVQGTTHSGQSGDTPSATFSSALASGQVVTGVVGWVGPNTGASRLLSVTDDKGNNYTVVGTQYNTSSAANYYWAGFYSSETITNGPSTITGTIYDAGSPAAFAVVIIDAWSGFPSGGVSALGQQAVFATSASTLSTSIISSNTALAVGYAVDLGSGGVTAGAGLTQVQNVGSTWLSEWVASSGNTQAVSATTGSPSGGTLWSFALGIAGPPPPPSDTTYYVSLTGSDSNNGTSTSTPWQTVGHVNSQMFRSGDQILFNGGQTFTDAGLSFGLSNYDSSNPPNATNILTIGSYGTGNATIAPSGAHGIEMVDISCYTIENLTLTGDNTSGKNGVWSSFTGGVGTGTNIILSGLTVSGFGQCGIYVTSSSDSVAITGPTISNCTVTACCGGTAIADQATSGIYITGVVGSTTRNFASPMISDCSVSNCPGVSGTSVGYWSGGGFALINVSGATITRCLAHDCGANNTGASGPAGFQFGHATSSIMQFSEAYNISSNSGTDGDAFDLDGDCVNCTIEYCYAHECVGAGLMAFSYAGANNTGAVIRYNISENCGANGNFPSYGCFVYGSGGTTSGAEVYNNTVYNSTFGASCFYGNQSSGAVSGSVYNNIFYNTQTSVNVIADSYAWVLDGNCYYSPNGGFLLEWQGTQYSTLAAIRTGTSQEAHGLSGNPQLTSAGSGGAVGGYIPPAPTAYHLLSGSPLIGTGIDLLSTFSINPGPQDFYGNSIPTGVGSGYNIGAFDGTTAASANPNLPLLGVGALLPIAAAWRMSKAVQENGIITRRRLLLPK